MNFYSEDVERRYSEMLTLTKDLPNSDMVISICTHCKMVEGRPAEGLHSDLECYKCGADMRWLTKEEMESSSLLRQHTEHRNFASIKD